MAVWQELINNLAIVAVFIAGWQYIGDWLDSRPVGVRAAALGVFSGACASVVMLVSLELGNGAIFDLRLSFLAVAGLFGGPVGAVASTLIAAPARAFVGGPVAGGGIAFIIVAALVGVAGNFFARKTNSRLPHIFAASLGMALLVLLAVALQPSGNRLSASDQYMAFGATAVFLTTLALSLAVRQRIINSDMRRLSNAATEQAPDFQFVKDRQGRYVVANRNVARFFGYDSVSELLGKNNFETISSYNAGILDENEQQLMTSGKAVENLEESLLDPDGGQRVFATSKSPVFSSDGRVIGLAGVARDMTEQRKAEEEMETQRSMLSHLILEMTDGLALFDTEGRLEFCNNQFRDSFPANKDMIKPGLRREDMIRATAAITLGPEKAEHMSDAQVASIVKGVHDGKAHELQMPNGHWLRIKGRRTSMGKSVLTVTDFTEIKMAQDALLTLTDQLKALASTDGLTGLMNRRSFDKRLEEDLGRSERSRSPISLLLIDVDRFKAFNDLYGHLAGDDCLRAIASCLKQASRRPDDSAARFGGEEFVLILPDLGEADALRAAERLRQSLVDLELVHEGSEHDVVTASIGVASYLPDETGRAAGAIIQRADEALYQAKADGRNRVVAWSSACELKRAAG